jgi:hypothetical protein
MEQRAQHDYHMIFCVFVAHAAPFPLGIAIDCIGRSRASRIDFATGLIAAIAAMLPFRGKPVFDIVLPGISPRLCSLPAHSFWLISPTSSTSVHNGCTSSIPFPDSLDRDDGQSSDSQPFCPLPLRIMDGHRQPVAVCVFSLLLGRSLLSFS